MAVNKKGSRKIVVDDIEFRWRATGSDEVISIVIWPTDNEDSRVIGRVGYHHDMVKVSEGHFTSDSQLVVTSRTIKAIIMHVGFQKILESHGQINIGAIEDFYDIESSVRGKYAK